MPVPAVHNRVISAKHMSAGQPTSGADRASTVASPSGRQGASARCWLSRRCCCWRWPLAARGRAHGGRSAGEATGLRFGESGPRTRVVVDFDRSVAFARPGRDRPEPACWSIWTRSTGSCRADAGAPAAGLVRGHELHASPSGGARLDGRHGAPGPNRRRHPAAAEQGQPQLSAGRRHGAPTDTARAPRRGERARSSRCQRRNRRPLAALPIRSPRGRRRRSRPRRESRRRELPVVVLDPGHGGVDPGATSVDGQLREGSRARAWPRSCAR